MEKSRKFFWLISVLSALAAVALHTYLGFKFYALRFGALGESSICNLNATWNCDAVSASSYAQFLGTPMAIWGLATNAVFAVILLIAGMDWLEDEERSQRYAVWFAGLILAASIVMGTISMTQLHSLCLFCVFAYLLSLIAFAASWVWAQPKLLPNLGGDVGALFSRHKSVLGALIAVPLLALFLNRMFVDNFNGGQMSLIAQEKLAQWVNGKPQTFAPDKGLILQVGPSPARMEIVEFADFLCPHCKEAFFGLDAFASSHPDVKLNFKYFPLDSGCNPASEMGPPGDGIRCEAAYYVECGEKLFKKGWAVHHHLFENQDRLHGMSSRDDVGEMVCKDLGLDCAAMKTCASDPATRTNVMAIAAEGVTSGVQGTPTVYVNGKQLPYGQFLPVLEKAYESLPAR